MKTLFLLASVVAVGATCIAANSYLTRPEPQSFAEAVEQGDLTHVQSYVDGGAKLDAPCGSGRTPLQLAAWTGERQVIALLVKNGANPNAPDEYGYTPLCCAATRGDIPTMAALVAAGADVNWRDKAGRTPLEDSVACLGSVQSVRWLLDHGADPNAVPLDGWTALHQAAARGDTEIVKLLVSRGAHADIRNSSGRTALGEARDAGQHAVVHLLWSLRPVHWRSHGLYSRASAGQSAPRPGPGCRIHIIPAATWEEKAIAALPTRGCESGSRVRNMCDVLGSN